MEEGLGHSIDLNRQNKQVQALKATTQARIFGQSVRGESPHEVAPASSVSAQLQQQIKQSFEELKSEVKNELLADPTFVAAEPVPQTRPAENNGLMDVDMLDVAELERERGEVEAEVGQANETQEQEELARARLQRQALTFE